MAALERGEAWPELVSAAVAAWCCCRCSTMANREIASRTAVEGKEITCSVVVAVNRVVLDVVGCLVVVVLC